MDTPARHVVVLSSQNEKALSFLETELTHLHSTITFVTKRHNSTKILLLISLSKPLEQDQSLSPAKKSQIITDALQQIRVTQDKIKEIVTAKSISPKVFAKPSLVALLQTGIIEAQFPLHIHKEQREIESQIWNHLYALPVEPIRSVR